MKKFLFILLCSSSILNAYCYVSSDCESALMEMEQNLTKRINNSFDKVDKEIDALTKEYQNELKEIDKELYTARIRLSAEQNLYLKLVNIENLIKKNVQLNNLNTTIDVVANEIDDKKKDK